MQSIFRLMKSPENIIRTQILSQPLALFGSMIAHEENPHMLTILKVQGVLVLPRKPYFHNLVDGEFLFIVEINLTFS